MFQTASSLISQLAAGASFFQLRIAAFFHAPLSGLEAQRRFVFHNAHTLELLNQIPAMHQKQRLAAIASFALDPNGPFPFFCSKPFNPFFCEYLASTCQLESGTYSFHIKQISNEIALCTFSITGLLI
jgi:hypothetical protein